LAEALGWTQQKHKPQQPELFVTHNEHEQKVLQCLGPEPKHIDLIAIEAQVKVSELASMLFLLEMKGVVSALAGKMFKRV
jgi:predicted Rossmann fold nucleotide-binding protein DprA/Smf involved in DNA uptake